MKLEFDLEKLNTKSALLECICGCLEEMYSPNYDAFIDAATSFDGPLELVFTHFKAFEDCKNLGEVLDIIAAQKPDVIIVK